MKPAPFEYHRAHSLGEALDLLARFGDEAKPLAGGQSLIPAMNFRLSQPAVLIDLNDVAELAYIRNGYGLRIGAMTRERALERDAAVARLAPLLAEALPWIAHPQIRNRGTVGGSIAHADPAGEIPAVMLALDASFTLRSANGERSVRAADFFTGLFGTALEPVELLTEIEVPLPAAGAGFAFDEIARRHGDYALAGVAATVQLDERGLCAAARVALLSVGDAPVLAPSATAVLVGNAPTADAIAAAADATSRDDIDPPCDIHASAEYRRHLVSVLTRRVLTRAFDRAVGPGALRERVPFQASLKE